MMKNVNLQLREDVRKGVYVENLSEVEVHGMQDVIHLLNQVMFKSQIYESFLEPFWFLFGFLESRIMDSKK